MADCYGNYWDAREALRHGVKLTLTQRLILERSDPLPHKEFKFSPRHGSISFSSTLADGATGCRFKQINYSHPYLWVKQLVPMTDEEEDRAWQKACELEGKLYDKWLIAGFLTRWRIIKPHPDKYICNEAVDSCILAAKPHWLLRPNPMKHDERHPVDSYFACRRNLELDLQRA